MNIMICSDLHLDINSKFAQKNLLDELVIFLYEQQPDLFLIAGDIANDSRDSLKVIDTIESLTEIPVKFVPGNHDIWTTTGSSEDSYNRLKNHHASLIDSPLLINENYAIIGDMGWYDYSFGPSYLDEEILRRYKKSYWNDAKYARWKVSDSDLCQEILERLEKQLEAHKDRSVIFVNHFIPYDRFISFQDEVWNICNSYLGSEKIGELIDKYPNICYFVFGHTHTRYPVENMDNKQVICRPLGYYHEWKTKNFSKELTDSTVCIKIE